jgi:hypothetical protein
MHDTHLMQAGASLTLAALRGLDRRARAHNLRRVAYIQHSNAAPTKSGNVLSTSTSSLPAQQRRRTVSLWERVHVAAASVRRRVLHGLAIRLRVASVGRGACTTVESTPSQWSAPPFSSTYHCRRVLVGRTLRALAGERLGLLEASGRRHGLLLLSLGLRLGGTSPRQLGLRARQLSRTEDTQRRRKREHAA